MNNKIIYGTDHVTLEDLKTLFWIESGIEKQILFSFLFKCSALGREYRFLHQFFRLNPLPRARPIDRLVIHVLIP